MRVERTRTSGEEEISGFCMINMQVEGWLCMGWFDSHASRKGGEKTCRLFYTSGHAWGWAVRWTERYGFAS